MDKPPVPAYVYRSCYMPSRSLRGHLAQDQGKEDGTTSVLFAGQRVMKAATEFGLPRYYQPQAGVRVMAKKKASGVNKSKAIKDYLAEKPRTAPKDVAAALKEQGVDVTPAYVSTIKTSMKKRKRGRRKKAAAKAAASGDQVSLAALLEAKKLVAKVGGVAQAKQAIAALAQLSD
jgi:hypothetical protein